MKARLLTGVAVVALWSCGRGADTTPPTFGAACTTDDDCKAPFSCIGGQASPHSCSKPCTDARDCPRYHWSPACAPDIDVDVQSECADGYCHAFIACQGGSDSGTDSARPISAVSSQKGLSSLSASEQARLCDDVVRYSTSTLLPDECLHLAVQLTAAEATNDSSISDANLSASCVSRLGGCLSSVNVGATTPGQDGGSGGGVKCDLSKLNPDCPVTVAEYEQCLMDTDAAYKGVPACDQVTRQLLEAISLDGGLTVASPASCAAVNACSTSTDAGTL
jgi:hypothetical protein